MQQCYKLQINNRFFRLLAVVFLFNITTQAVGVGDRKADINFSSPPIVIAVDLNRDGKVDKDINQIKPEDILAGKKANDATTPALPYRFWVNNDLDVVNNSGLIKWDDTNCNSYNTYNTTEYRQKCEQWDEDPVDAGLTNTSPNKLNKIESYRDLEDFAPLLMYIVKGFNPDDYTLKLRAVGVSVNLFKSNWNDTDTQVAHEYIFETQKTIEQVQLANALQSASNPKGHFATLRSGAAGIKITQQIIDDYFDPDTGEARFIFEAIAPSPSGCKTNAENCYLEMEVSKEDDETFNKSISRVYMDIHDIKDFYELVKAGPSAQEVGGRYVVEEEFGERILQAFHAEYNDEPVHTVPQKVLNIYDGLFTQQQITKDYVLQIHGWRMKDSEKTSFSETSFKRLYWSGYKGQMGALHWPTGWFDKPAYAYGFGVLPYVLGNERNYDISEVVARRVGVNLVPWLSSKKQTGTNIHTIAHSMGNVVLSEALHYGAGGSLTSYAASQAAIDAGSYDSGSPDINHLLQDTAFTSCLIDVLSNALIDPESAWRCYNLDSFPDTPFDMPPDMYRYDFIARTDIGEPETDTNGNFIIRHGQTTVGAMTPYPIPTDGLTTPGHYFATIGSNVRIINLFNSQDLALNGWEFNQLTKPDFAQGETWHYTNTYLDALAEYNLCDPEFETCLIPELPEEVVAGFRRGNTVVPFNQATEFEILAHVIPARTLTLGQVLTHGEIRENPEMLGLTNSNQDHSAPYHGFYSEKSKKIITAQQRAAYWNILLDRSIYPVNKNNLTKLANGKGL